jgi:hypothetical protein
VSRFLPNFLCFFFSSFFHHDKKNDKKMFCLQKIMKQTWEFMKGWYNTVSDIKSWQSSTKNQLSDRGQKYDREGREEGIFWCFLILSSQEYCGEKTCIPAAYYTGSIPAGVLTPKTCLKNKWQKKHFFLRITKKNVILVFFKIKNKNPDFF